MQVASAMEVLEVTAPRQLIPFVALLVAAVAQLRSEEALVMLAQAAPEREAQEEEEEVLVIIAPRAVVRAAPEATASSL